MDTIKVLFKDNTTIDIENVDKFQINIEFDMFFVYVGSRKIMIPRDTVKMIGQVEDFDKGLKLEHID